MKTSAPIVKLGRYQSLITTFGKSIPCKDVFNPKPLMGDSFLDATSFAALEIDNLISTFGSPQLRLGEYALYRAFTSSQKTRNVVIQRQDALRELSQNKELRGVFEALIEETSNDEKGLFDLLWARFQGFFGSSATEQGSTQNNSDFHERPGFGYTAFKHTRRLLRLVKKASTHQAFKLKEVKSPFLVGILEDLNGVNTSRVAQLFLDKTIVTESGLKTRDEKKWWVPGYCFRPTFIKPILFSIIFASVYLVVNFVQTNYASLGSGLGPISFFIGIPFFIFAALTAGSIERDNVIVPLGKQFRQDPEMLSLLDALGEIEVLLLHHRFSEQFPGPICLPEIIEAEHHQLTVDNLWNASMGIQNGSYVANDVALSESRLTFVTGPNSGGKTALCKTLCQAQILAQSGAYIPAKNAIVSIVKHIFYQVPEAGTLESQQGRFATELERTRDIFFNSSGQCLVVLDEPFEGTSYEERFEITQQVLDGFIKLGASVLFITHNFQLVKSYRNHEAAQFLQTVFENNAFTHQFVEGVATTSHANRVASQLGFSKDDIDKHVQNI